MLPFLRAQQTAAVLILSGPGPSRHGADFFREADKGRAIFALDGDPRMHQDVDQANGGEAESAATLPHPHIVQPAQARPKFGWGARSVLIKRGDPSQAAKRELPFIHNSLFHYSLLLASSSMSPNFSFASESLRFSPFSCVFLKRVASLLENSESAVRQRPLGVSGL